MIKIIGKPGEMTPAECFQQFEELNAEMDKLRPYKKPKEFVLRFKTYDELYNFDITRASRKI
jgi:hypothetical protein